MYDGSTALILAARLAVEGMVEELITCHADVNAVDELGTSLVFFLSRCSFFDVKLIKITQRTISMYNNACCLL